MEHGKMSQYAVLSLGLMICSSAAAEVKSAWGNPLQSGRVSPIQAPPSCAVWEQALHSWATPLSQSSEEVGIL